MLHQSEHLVPGVLVLVALAGQAHADALGDVADAVAPVLIILLY